MNDVFNKLYWLLIYLLHIHAVEVLLEGCDVPDIFVA